MFIAHVDYTMPDGRKLRDTVIVDSDNGETRNQIRTDMASWGRYEIFMSAFEPAYTPWISISTREVS
jgi:hypothetical protein